MSQEKVDRYKEKKYNRQKLMKREKWVRRLEYTAAALVAAAMVGWFGYSVYEKAQNSRDPVTYEMECTAVNDYLNTLNA